MARGTFEVTITPKDSDDGIGRFGLAKTWSGDLTGESHGLMLSAGDPTRGSAGYVALELVEGDLHGRAGSFAFQQLGVMHGAGQRLDYLVVPGSGTGELAGVTGTLELILDESEHRYELTYRLDADADAPDPTEKSAEAGLTVGAVVWHVQDARRAATFWTQALGYEAEADAPDFLVPPDGRGVRLHLDETDRTHLDLWVDRSTTTPETEVERLVALGATRVEWTYPEDADFVVLADTEGNLFCVIT